MYKFIAIAVVAVCGVGALHFSRSTAPGEPASTTDAEKTAQVEAATSLPAALAPAAGQPAASSCKDKLTVKLSTSADAKEAGRIVVGKWHTRAQKLYGVEFANFKAAEEPAVHCQKSGKGSAQSCVAEARPCAK